MRCRMVLGRYYEVCFRINIFYQFGVFAEKEDYRNKMGLSDDISVSTIFLSMFFSILLLTDA